MQAGDSKRTASGDRNDSYKIPAAGSLLSSSAVSVVSVLAAEADFVSSSTPRLGGALPRLYRTILAVTSAAIFFLCLSVRFMAFDEVGPARCAGSAICSGTETDSSVGVDTVAPEASARSSKEITPMEYTPYGDNRPADERCERAAKLRPCSPRDMTFTVHFSVRPGRVGSCVTLSANVSRCLRGANRFWTLRDCEAACNHALSVAPLKTSSNYAETSTMTTTTHSRRRRRRCRAAVSFGPCSAADRRRSSANFVFEHGRCAALRAGSCTDAGFSTLRHCRSACLEKDPLQIDEFVNSTLA